MGSPTPRLSPVGPRCITREPYASLRTGPKPDSHLGERLTESAPLAQGSETLSQRTSPLLPRLSPEGSRRFVSGRGVSGPRPGCFDPSPTTARPEDLAVLIPGRRQPARDSTRLGPPQRTQPEGQTASTVLSEPHPRPGARPPTPNRSPEGSRLFGGLRVPGPALALTCALEHPHRPRRIRTIILGLGKPRTVARLTSSTNAARITRGRCAPCPIAGRRTDPHSHLRGPKSASDHSRFPVSSSDRRRAANRPPGG